MKHSNWILVIGIAIALVLVGSWSYTTHNNPAQAAESFQNVTMEKATQKAAEVAFKPIWQVSKRLIRID